MQQLFTKESKIFKERVLTDDSRKASEKIFIIDFFKNLPIEDLKRLVNFKVMDYENQELWNNVKNDDFLLHELKNRNLIQYSCELYLDNGVDDLSLGQISSDNKV